MNVVEPDCSTWAKMIQDGEIDREKIEKTIQDCLEKEADVIVLGCTHYHWIKNMVIEMVAGRATVLEPSEAIARRVQSVLEGAGVHSTPPSSAATLRPSQAS